MQYEVARKAARWWADQLTKPAKLDMGDGPDVHPGIGLSAARLQDQEGVVDQEAADRFAHALRCKLRLVEKQYFHIHCDYDADPLLAETAEQVGIPIGMTTFPWKTVMWIENGSITVKEGYTGSRVEL